MHSRVSLTVLLFSLILQFGFEAGAHTSSGKYFDRAIFVLFENTNYAEAVRQPFMNQLGAKGALFSNFLALTHPSQGNYIALTSGSLNGVYSDGVYNLNVRNIIDLLEAKGLSWKVYAEGYPGNCFTGRTYNGYARKHNPFISYTNIQKDPARCAKIVNAAEFAKDAASNSLPNYVFYIPDLRNDGHDTGVAFADRWYAKTFGPYLSDKNFMSNTVVITTFDESGASAKNQVYTSIFGPAVKPTVVSSPLNIYSLLALIEENWGLGNLTQQDSAAALPPNIWN